LTVPYESFKTSHGAGGASKPEKDEVPMTAFAAKKPNGYQARLLFRDLSRLTLPWLPVMPFISKQSHCQWQGRQTGRVKLFDITVLKDTREVKEEAPIFLTIN
jgi:hypothetical protein